MKRKRPAPKRRKKRSAVARVRPFWILIALAGVLFVAGITFVVSWPGFTPQQIAVSGNRIVSRSEILTQAAIAPRVNVWLQNTRAIAERIEAIPSIDHASVHRLPPATIRIVVSERVPFAILTGDGDAVVVDRSLRVLQAASGGSVLPVLRLGARVLPDPGTFVTDPTAVELRDAYEAMLAAHVVPRALALDRFDGLVATMRGGVRVLLGQSTDLNAKLPLVNPILAQAVGSQRRVAAVDLRAPSTPVLVYK